MSSVLTNRSFQVFIIILGALAAVSILIHDGNLTSDSLLYTIVGFGLGVPVSPSAPADVANAIEHVVIPPVPPPAQPPVEPPPAA